MARRRRSTGAVDRLPAELKETIEQMLVAGDSYRAIVEYLRDNGVTLSRMSVCRYAQKYLATVEMLRLSNENFRMLAEELDKYPDLDTTEAIIRMASQHVMGALANSSDEDWQDIKLDKLLRETHGLIKAAAYKKRLDLQNKSELEAGFESVKSTVFTAMAKERPELYRQVAAFLDEKRLQEEGTADEVVRHPGNDGQGAGSP